ncbi:MAG TPA: DOMON-like domain-containing protein [Azonexus sp.]|nr:DOMON-like domain-containing protein [Azonexus sp.]
MLTCPESSATVTPHHALLCHPVSPCAAVRAIEASAIVTASGALALSYRLQGDPEKISIPAPVPPAAADDLWQHTCLEAFVAAADDAGYREFNFSPAGLWANYRFTACRQRNPDFLPPAAPRIAFQRCADGFRLDAWLAPELLPASGKLNIGLTAVIATRDGGRSYWALAHCAAQPDFHLRQSFSLTLQRTTP